MAISVVYGVPTDRCGLQLRLGIQRGFFRELGIDFALRVVYGGPEIAAEFDSGRLKIGELGTPPGLTALAGGAHFKVVGSSVRRGAVQYFVAHPRFTEWQDLLGAKLGALSHGSCSDWYMRAVLSHHAIDPDHDVTVVSLGPRYPQIMKLLESGELDGAIMSEPHVTVGEEAGLFKVWLGINALHFVPRIQWTIMVANSDVVAKEPNLVHAVIEGCRRSYHYAADNREEWASFGASHYGITHVSMMKSIDREFDALHFDCEIDIEGMDAAIALQQKLGSVKKPMRLFDIADERFMPKNPGQK